jgi:hypothetical protein
MNPNHRDILNSTLRASCKFSAATAKAAFKVSVWSGSTVYRNRRPILGALKHTGLAAAEFSKATVSSSVDLVRGLNRAKRRELEELKEDSSALTREHARLQEQYPDRFRTIDAWVLGGYTLAELLTSQAVDPAVEAAFEAAYPGLAAHTTFAEHAAELDQASLAGLVSGVKGKLFEQDYVRHLNAGNLPEGFTAALAESPTQEAWDISIHGPDGAIVDEIQAKATDSMDYIRAAVTAHPEIDVVSTHEVASHLLLLGAGSEVIDSGITNADLTETVLSATGAHTPSAFELSPLTLAFFGLTTWFFTKPGSPEEFAGEFGARLGRAYPARAGGLLVAGALISPIGWPALLLAPLTTFGLRHASELGATQHDLIVQLRKTLATQRKILARIRQDISPEFGGA